MKLEDLVAVSGMSGLFKMAANRNNGLIIEDLDTGKRKFAPSRKHQFTPLATIGIYTLEDSKELNIVFDTILEQLESNPPPVGTKAPSADYHTWFRKILADYDEDRVQTSDLKKLIKWFNFINERKLFPLEAPEKEETKEEEKETKEEKKEGKKEEPKKKKATAKKD